MSCWTELYLPIQDVEWCTWITQDRAIPVVVKGIIYTKKCPDGVVEYDREKVVMCEKNTWAKVLVESWSDVNDPAQAITKRYTYLVWNTPFVWNPDTDLVDCWSEKLDIQTKQYCDNWETVWWTLVWDVSESTPVLIGIVFNKIDASIHTPISPVEWSCEVIIANRQIPVIEDCALATTPTDVNWKIAEEVILWWSTKVIPVRIQENCVEPSLRDVIIDTDCAWTDETVQVEWNIQEVILHPSQAIKVVVDKSCETQLTADVPNCDWTTTTTNVDEINATYLLNQANKQTKTVYDNVQLSIIGTISQIISWWSLSFDLTNITATWTVLTWIYQIEFGNWASIISNNPSFNFVNEPDWHYQAHVYALVVIKWEARRILINWFEFDVLNGLITTTASVVPINRVLEYTVWCAFQDYCNWTLVWYPYNADTTVYTVQGTIDICSKSIEDERASNPDAHNSECNLFPITNCFCAMVSGSTTRKETTEKAKATSTSPVKATICETLRYDCKQVVKAKTYTIAGKPYTALQFAWIKYTKIECNAPTPTYSAWAVTCTTYPDPIDWTIVLNATVYTNDSNPSDVQTVYTLASNYPTVGNIWDLYIVADEDLLVDCPPWSIIETELCYKALIDIKWIAVAWDTINIQSIENVTAWTTRYTIKHVGSWAIIYAGVDPLTDIGIDPDAMNPAEWVVTPCVPTPVVYWPIDTKEICAFVNWGTQQYCLTRVFSRHPQTGVMTILHYEDSQGNIIDWDVVETCCDWSAVCYSATPSVFRVKDYYSVNSDSFLSNLWSPAPTTYSYRVTNVVVNWTALSWYPITSTAWTSSSNTIVPTQVAPYNTIPAYQNLWGWQWVMSDTNWINFLNSLSIPFFTFQLSPLEETLDWLSIAWGYWFGNPIDSTLVYWDWFQIVYPDWYTFSITVEALYDGVLWHTMVFTESSNIIDGASMTGAPTTWLIF